MFLIWSAIYTFRVYNLFGSTEPTLSSGPFSPSNVEQAKPPKQETNDMKRKTDYTLPDNVLSFKSETFWEMEPLRPSERRPDSDFSIDMDARTVLELCK